MAVLTPVDDAADPRLADYVSLRDVALRRHLEAEHGFFVAEGEKVVRRAVEAGFEARSFLMTPRWLDGLAAELDAAGDVPCFVVSDEVAEQVTGFHVHRGALASMRRLPLPSVDDVLAGARRVAVLEDFVDHGNVGSAFRNAAALGVGAVLVTPRCADPLYRRSIKTSMGAALRVPWTRIDPWPDGVELLRSEGYAVVAMALSDDAVALDDLRGLGHDKTAFVFGTEGDGLRAATLERADVVVRIPMSGGIDSLNVAAATAVTFYATR